MVITRFAPSPTGELHIGGIRTALFNYLFAEAMKGKFILRIEDTDVERSTQKSVRSIFEGLSWCGIPYQSPVVFQTERMERYKEVINKMLEEGTAYYCYCSKKELDDIRTENASKGLKNLYNRSCRENSLKKEGNPVVRFKNPIEGVTSFNDAVRGTITVSNSELDDWIIARSDRTPTYNFTVVVDDMDMKVSHVIRGDDHINNTPKQLNLMKALGASIPTYVHLPMLLGENGDKLSKRTNAASILFYREEGYLPEAVLNYLLKLGWGYKDKEVFSLEESKQLFNLEGINTAATKINPKKLDWLNHKYMNSLSFEIIKPHLKYQFFKLGILDISDEYLEKVYKVQSDRFKNLKSLAEDSIYFFETPIVFESASQIQNLMVKLKTIRDAIADLDSENFKEISNISDIKSSEIFSILRTALVGKSASASMTKILEVLGKETVLKRIDAYICFLEFKDSI